MVALIPSEADLDRLALDGGELRDDIHLTLAFLGRSFDWSAEQQSLLMRSLVEVTNELPITAEAFGANHWNVGTENPSWVLAIGGIGGVDLSLMHSRVWSVLLEQATDLPTIPAQHEPWVPHICIAYSDDPGLAPVIEERLGKITFEYLRVAFGDDIVDIVLGSAMRDLTTESCVPCGTIADDLTAGGLMPYDVRRGGGTCSAGRWAVVNRNSGKTMGCHGSKADARKQQAALYVKESNGVQDEAELIVQSLELMHEMDVPDDDGELEVLTDEQDEHFHVEDFASVDTTPWNGSAAMGACSNAGCYRSICAGRRAGDPSERQTWALPHHKSSGGPPNAGGVRNALSRLPQTKGLTNAGAARRHLEAHMSSISNTGVEGDEHFAVEDVEDDTTATTDAYVAPNEDGSCPEGYRKLGDNCVADDSSSATTVALGGDPSSGTPPDKRKKANGKQGRGYEVIREQALAVEGTPEGRWEAVLTVEGRETGDGREFGVDSLTWDEMPVTLTYQPPSHGGVSTDGIVVGRIDEIWRDGELIRGRGVFDMKDPAAVDIARKVDEGFLKGVSVDVDDYAADMEFVWPEEAEGSESEEATGLEQILFGRPEKVIYHKGRVRGAAVVTIPAFVEGIIRLVKEDEEGLAAGGSDPFRQYGPVGAHDAPTSDEPWDGHSCPPSPTACTGGCRTAASHSRRSDASTATFLTTRSTTKAASVPLT
jgi:2'-5' RNA ligase